MLDHVDPNNEYPEEEDEWETIYSRQNHGDSEKEEIR
jgi:hypothetical protein